VEESAFKKKGVRCNVSVAMAWYGKINCVNWS